MKKKKEEVKVELLEEPAHSFCKACKVRDLRVIQDTLNLCYITLGQVTDHLGFDGSLKKRCKDLTSWVRDEQRKEELRNKKTIKKRGKNESKV
jgi:hypothetical protein